MSDTNLPPSNEVCREMMLRYAQSLREYRHASLSSLAQPTRDTKMIRDLFDTIECNDVTRKYLGEAGRWVERNMSPERVERIRSTRAVDAEDEMAARKAMAAYIPLITHSLFASFDLSMYFEYAFNVFLPPLIQPHTALTIGCAMALSASPRFAPMRFGLGVLAGSTAQIALHNGPRRA